MALLRRRTAQPTTAPAATPLRIRDKGDGVLMMRRVELKSSSTNPHWYFETRSDRDAVMKMANSCKPRGNPDLYHVVDSYVSH